ncbi:MAG: Ig-like domain-containing protein [Gemmatimonadaceae bacterium]
MDAVTSRSFYIRGQTRVFKTFVQDRNGALAFLLACGSGATDATRSDVALASLEVESAPGTLQVGETVALHVMARTSDGSVIQSPSVKWFSRNTEIATVNNGGVVTTIAPGSTIVTATAGKAIGAASIVVLGPAMNSAVAKLSISASSAITVGESVKFTVVATTKDNVQVGNAPIAWSSSNEWRATVAADGTVHAISPGSVNIVAMSGSVTTSIAVTVIDPATSVTLVMAPYAYKLQHNACCESDNSTQCYGA